LKRLGKFSSDDARLQRIVPSVVSLLQDQDAMVRAWSIRVLADTLALTESFPPSDSQLFPQYIFKRVAHLVTDPSLVVRVAFAESIALLSETAHRFLDISQAMRLYEAVGDGGGPTQSSTKDSPSEPGIFGDDITMLLDQTPGDGDPTSSQQRGPKAAQRAEREHSANDENDGDGIETTLISQTYTADLASLHETVSRWVFQITTDMSEHSSFAKRALLSDLARLCTFFGHDGVMACVLPQVLAFLNDRQDWHLRAALCQHLPSICAVIGRAATGHFVLPCLETALVDGEDKVMSQAELCLASLVEMKLLSRSMLLGTFGSALSTERRTGRNTNHKSNGSRRDSGYVFLKNEYLILCPDQDRTS
jgi:phosphoinositide-3-kinase regulatory subunit 4